MASEIESVRAKIIGEKLRLSRIGKGISGVFLANEIGCSQSQISRIESGRFNRFGKVMHKLCFYLGVEPDICDHDLEQAIQSLDIVGRKSEKARRLIIELAQYLADSK